MSSTIETPSILTTEITQPTPYQVVIGTPPVIVTQISNGAQGIAGANGGGYPDVLEFEATVAGAQNVNFGVPFHPGSTALFINGIRQRQISYSFSTGQLHLPQELEIFPDDLITFHYYPLS